MVSKILPLAFLFSVPVLRLVAAGEVPPMLTRASDVRALNATEAQEKPSVRLSGVVLLPPVGWGNSFVIADDSAAIYCEGPRSGLKVRLKHGDFVSFSGHAEPGGFAPFVMVDHVQVEGTGNIPRPTPLTFDQMASGSFDSQWVEISGIVRRSQQSQSPKGWLVELATGGGRLKVLFRDVKEGSQGVDSEVRMAGVCFYQFSKFGHVINPLLVVPAGYPGQLVRPPPVEVPLLEIDRLMSFSSQGSFGHSVRVRGVVTYHLPGVAFWIEEGGRGLRVNDTTGRLHSQGEAVEVTGFPVHGSYSPELEDIRVESLALSGSPPTPQHLKSSGDALDHDAGLIRLNATMIEKIRVPLGMRFMFRDERGDFPAQLRLDAKGANLPDWETGSEVSVTGICQVSEPATGAAPGTLIPSDFGLIMRSPADLQVVRAPPWLNAERRATLLATSTAVLGLAVGLTVWSARWRLRQSISARRYSEAEFSAILAERSRIAREIHDTLAQGLGAISLHLEVVRSKVPNHSEAAMHLAVASGLTRNSLQEARNSIWNMRSQVLETNDLAGALAGVLDQLTEIDNIESGFIVRGNRFRLSPVIENNLLRIGQEAIANAVKHSNARHIEVTLEFSPGDLTIRVKDDGCGFNAGKSPCDGSHFGLVGLRERTKELGATLRIESSPDCGTEITLEFPITKGSQD